MLKGTPFEWAKATAVDTSSVHLQSDQSSREAGRGTGAPGIDKEL